MFMAMILVIIFFFVLWNFDLHKLIRVKSVTQNAGDAAALVAARWQGVTLNLIGDLNIMHALALSAGDDEAAAAITNTQARLAYAGPMVALLAAQQAAKNNGIYVHPGFTERLSEHAERVRNDYTSATTPDGEFLFPEPYPGCWDDYADMLGQIAAEGVAAGPDNAQLYRDISGGHYLLMLAFYEAVAGRTWCWFYHNAMDLLLTYNDYHDWAPLPDPPHTEYLNSEIFGLGLTTHTTMLSNFLTVAEVEQAAEDRELGGQVTTNAMAQEATWYCYDSTVWTPWEALSQSVPEPFPIAGEVRPQYDYAGADAAVRVEAQLQRLTPAAGGTTVSNTILWTAAAKPFGYLEESRRPDSYSLVLPAFREVRLIPIDASSAPSGGGYNLDWRDHIENHLPDYLDDGQGEPGCWYCRQLTSWDDAAFRQSGIDWLEENSHLCTLPSGGGSRRGGGTRRGH